MSDEISGDDLNLPVDVDGLWTTFLDRAYMTADIFERFMVEEFDEIAPSDIKERIEKLSADLWALYQDIGNALPEEKP